MRCPTCNNLLDPQVTQCSHCRTGPTDADPGEIERPPSLLHSVIPTAINHVTEALEEARAREDLNSDEHVHRVFKELLAQHQQDMNAVRDVAIESAYHGEVDSEFEEARRAARIAMRNVEHLVDGSGDQPTQKLDASPRDMISDIAGSRNTFRERIIVETVLSEESDEECTSQLPTDENSTGGGAAGTTHSIIQNGAENDGDISHHLPDVDPIPSRSAPTLRRSPRRHRTTEAPTNQYQEGPQLEQINMDQSLIQDRCCNCMRTHPATAESGDVSGPDLETYMFKLVDIDLMHFSRYIGGRTRHRKYVHIQFEHYPLDGNGRRMGKICGQCFAHLDSPNAKNNDAETVWPAWVWTLLTTDSNSPLELEKEIWRLMPLGWRTWWCRSHSRTTGLSISSLLRRSTVFVEASDDLQKDIDALQGLRWADDIMPRESSLCLPTVKCPCGASEWKHKANTLPIDVVWQECLAIEIPHYTAKDKGRENLGHWF